MPINEMMKVFLGNTPSEQRKYLNYALSKCVKAYPILHLPAVGQFALAKIAIEAGYKPENLYCSDISLFSSVLGYYYAGKPLSELNINIDAEYLDEYRQLDNDLDRTAYLFWLMKFLQIPDKNFFMGEYKNHFSENKEKYINQLKGNLEKDKAIYGGLKYDVKDLRIDCNLPDEDGKMVIINPPAFTKGYERMFEFDHKLSLTVDIQEFSWNKEYKTLYEIAKSKKMPYWWYRYKSVGDVAPKEEVMFGKEYTDVRWDYWLCTKPDVMKTLGVEKLLTYKNKQGDKVLKHKICPIDMKITEKTVITFKKVDMETCLYYRELWAHKLGTTKAESYYLMLLDGMVFGAIGFHLAALRGLKENHIFEVFGFNSPLPNHPKANRLLMMAICCQEFEGVIRKNDLKRNRFCEIHGLKTTCLAKYRKVKLNNGLLEIYKKEQMDNGFYKIGYITNWHKRNFKECVKEFLNEERRGKDE